MTMTMTKTMNLFPIKGALITPRIPPKAISRLGRTMFYENTSKVLKVIGQTHTDIYEKTQHNRVEK